MLRIDHIVYVAPVLATAVLDLEERFGVRAGNGGKHPGLGTHNALISLGPRTYLEIIAPDPDQPRPSKPLPFGAEGVTAGRLGGWALACDDIESAIESAGRLGYDLGHVIDGERDTPSGTALRWRFTSNAMTAGLVPFLINWGDTQHPAASAPQGLRLESFHLEHPDPGPLARLLATLGSPVQVEAAATPAVVADIRGSNGSQQLR